MSSSLEGIGQVLATLKVADGTAEGTVVTVTAEDTVGKAAENGKFCGVLVRDEGDGVGAVQLEGIVTVSYSDTAPAVGYSMLAGDGKGGVKTVTSGGISYLVLSVDTASGTAVIKL